MIRVSCLVGSALALVLLVTSAAQAQFGAAAAAFRPPCPTS